MPLHYVWLWHITQQYYKQDSGTELDIEQVKALLFAAKADIPDLEANYLSKVYVIATLLNEPVQSLVERLQEQQDTIELPGFNLEVQYETEIPADLVQNRPDIRPAEQNLISATADMGVATAEMLPSIGLSGSIIGFGTGIWSFRLSITIPVFNQGSLLAQRNVEISEAKQAEITWRQTILDAIQDVQTSNSAWLRDKVNFKDFLWMPMIAL